MAASSGATMLRDVYNMLWSGGLEPRWVDGEVHIEIHGRSFAVAASPHGVTIRKQHMASPAEMIADICADMGQVRAALGLGPGKPPIANADHEKRRGHDR
jgi:hypothetical protein